MITFTIIETSKFITLISLFFISYFKLDISIKKNKKTHDKATQTITEEILRKLGKEIVQEVELEYNHIEKPILKKKTYFSWN
jgi:tmRNA-binding protein